MEFRSANVWVAMILGAVLVVVGLAGFFVTDTLIVFGVNTLHNWIHLLTGAVLLGAAMAVDPRWSRVANITLGLVYGVVAVLGFADVIVPDLLGMAGDTFANADNYLHTLLAVVLLVVAFADRSPATRQMPGAGRAT